MTKLKGPTTAADLHHGEISLKKRQQLIEQIARTMVAFEKASKSPLSSGPVPLWAASLNVQLPAGRVEVTEEDMVRIGQKIIKHLNFLSETELQRIAGDLETIETDLQVHIAHFRHRFRKLGLSDK